MMIRISKYLQYNHSKVELAAKKARMEGMWSIGLRIVLSIAFLLSPEGFDISRVILPAGGSWPAAASISYELPATGP
jgi:hypothetical protein